MSQRRKASCLVALRIGEEREEREREREREREGNLLIPTGGRRKEGRGRGRSRGAQIGGQISHYCAMQLGASIYDVRTERERGQEIPQICGQTRPTDFADKEGRRSKRPLIFWTSYMEAPLGSYSPRVQCGEVHVD